MKKKKLITMFGAIALIGAIGAGSTFAYLTAETGTVSNTFEVGNVNFDDDLGGGLTESKVERGQSGLYEDADGEKAWTVTGNNYTNLVANEVVYKDPTIHMADDSQDAWVFAKIVNSNGDALTVSQYNTAQWEDVTAAYAAANQLVASDLGYVVYATKAPVTAGTDSTIFTQVTVGQNVTEDTNFSDITITACAVQAAGFNSNTDAVAYAVFQ